MTYSIIIANKFVNFKLIKTIKSIAIQKCLKETEVIIVNKDKNNNLIIFQIYFQILNLKLLIPMTKIYQMHSTRL